MEQKLTPLSDTTIVAPATATGGALTIVRISGPEAIEIADRLWCGRTPLRSLPDRHAAYGPICTPATKETNDDTTPRNTIDEAIATIFRAPHSFTGEDTVEFTLHGSQWITATVIKTLVAEGATPAEPGEFSRRAFMNGKIDLAQAEGIADLIASSSQAAHRLAMAQTRGSFSKQFNTLRDQLIDFASLLELELDFSEEEVEFADRNALLNLADTIIDTTQKLADSYSAGRVLKEGVPVVIAGRPNAGKSTLLNHLLDDDKAIVSDIPGTTRDIIEDTIEIDGILYRLIDTAGLRNDTDDPIERQGIDKAKTRIQAATIILWLQDPTAPEDEQTAELKTITQTIRPDQTLIPILTKSDLPHHPTIPTNTPTTQNCGPNEVRSTHPTIPTNTPATQNCGPNEVRSIHPTIPQQQESQYLQISAKTGEGIQTLKARMKQTILADKDPATDLIVTNARHHAALADANSALLRARTAMQNGLSADLIAQDVREAIHHLGLLTGTITTDNLLQTIFARFCIGK